MRRLKIWLWERFLPAWAKDSVYWENQALREKLAAQAQELRELAAYAGGLEAALHSMRRIVIQNGGRP